MDDNTNYTKMNWVVVIGSPIMSTIFVPDDGGDTIAMTDVGDYKTPPFPAKDASTIKKLFDDMPNVKMREDDIMLCSFPKTGIL